MGEEHLMGAKHTEGCGLGKSDLVLIIVNWITYPEGPHLAVLGVFGFELQGYETGF